MQEIPVAHTFNEGQIEWFKAGSALNLVCGFLFRLRSFFVDLFWFDVDGGKGEERLID